MVKIWLDAGHGGKDSGAVGNGLLEKNLTLAICDKIASKLFNYDNVQLQYTRRQDSTVSLQQRVNWANTWGADFFLSIHINAGGGTGFESFHYVGLPGTAKAVQLQSVLHDEILKSCPQVNRGKKRADFYVLRETSMAAVLTENGFIDNSMDALKLKQEDFLDKLAAGHVNGLVKFYNLQPKAAAPAIEKPTAGGLFYVQVGAFSDRKNAEALVQRLQAAGFPAIIK